MAPLKLSGMIIFFMHVCIGCIYHVKNSLLLELGAILVMYDMQGVNLHIGLRCARGGW